MIRPMFVRLSVLAVLAALTAPFLAACGSDKPSPPSAAPAPAAPASASASASAPAAARKAPAPPAVKPYQDDAYGFAVEAARAPTKGEQQVPMAIGTLTAHTYMFSSALYQILVVHLDSAKGFQEEGERFVDSFRFVPRKS